MNFENMPELKFEYAYYIMLAVMASIVAVLLYLFRKMRWI
jgi:magnesium transporter